MKNYRDYVMILGYFEKRWGLSKGSYAVHGSGPLAAHGLRYVVDLDVIVTPAQLDILEGKLKFAWVDPNMRTTTPITAAPSGVGRILRHGMMEFFDELVHGDAQRVIAEAEEVDGIMCARLAEIRRWKLCMGREKDLKDVELIDAYLS